MGKTLTSGKPLVRKNPILSSHPIQHHFKDTNIDTAGLFRGNTGCIGRILITYLGNVDLAVNKLFVLLGLSSLTCTKRPRKTLVMSSPTSIRWPDMAGLHLWFLTNTTRSLWKMLIGWTLPLFLIGILIISILASKPWKGATCWKLMAGLWNDPNTC